MEDRRLRRLSSDLQPIQDLLALAAIRDYAYCWSDKTTEIRTAIKENSKRGVDTDLARMKSDWLAVSNAVALAVENLEKSMRKPRGKSAEGRGKHVVNYAYKRLQNA